MTKYAHVKDGAVVRIINLTAAEIADIPAHKLSYILPYIDVAQPAYDPATHHAPVRLTDIIGSSDVTQAWAAAVAKTAGEIDADKNAIADKMDLDPYLRAFALVMLDEINLLRGLHSLAPRTAVQIKGAIKGKLP